jgi:hypothetical protein
LLAVSGAGGAVGGGASGGARVVTRRPAYDLQGELRAFPPALVFQMLSLAGLDGRLTLRAPGSTCEAYFQRGHLVFARGGGQQGTIGEELVRRGLVERDACEAAAAERARKRGGPRIGAILVERGLVRREDLESLIRSRIKDAIYGCVDWRDGKFMFECGVFADDEDILLDVALESLLLECMARLDERRDGDHA